MNSLGVLRHCILALAALAVATQAAEARPFVVAGTDDMAPYQFTGSDGHPAGILVSLYGECFRRLGIEFEYETLPSPGAETRLRKGEADAISAAQDDKASAYSEPGGEVLAIEHMVAFASSNDPHFDAIMKAQSVGDLIGLHMLALAGSRWAAANLPADALVAGRSRDDLLVMLAANRADLLIDDDALARQRLDRLRAQYPRLPFDTVAGAPKALATLEIHMLLSKKSAYLRRLGDIDRTFGEMRRDGTIGRIYGQFGLPDQTGAAPAGAPAPPAPPPPDTAEPGSPAADLSVIGEPPRIGAK